MSIGFKEWALVCQALGHGRQHVIIRKGGIAEGRDGFQFTHGSFLLFPTLFHEQVERTILPADTPLPESPADTVQIEYRAEVVWTRVVGELAVARRLAPYHILKSEVVEERFHYDAPPGVSVALVRIFRLAEPWTFPMERAYGGCRSWVTLRGHPAAEDTPIESSEAFSAVRREIEHALGIPGRTSA